MIVSHRPQPETASLSVAQTEHIQRLHDFLVDHKNASIQEIETEVYAIPKKANADTKELGKARRAFFKDVYNLLIGQDIGPRLSTFLWAVDRQRIVSLLAVEQ